MWKELLITSVLWQTADALLWLYKSDPICRDESWLYYWKTRYSHDHHNHSPYDITSKCEHVYQTWYGVLCLIMFIAWLSAVIPAVANFIEGVERRTVCCDEVEDEDDGR